ncbi:MAG: ArsC family reductase [Granulosicoccaceae bacterium]
MSITLYGIPNCNTVKKARRWLADAGIAYTFHDYKKQGITEAKLRAWSKEKSWELLLNKRGTTFRKLDESQRANITQSSAIKLMKEHTSMIKRPVIEGSKELLIGFDEASYKANLN